jgi:hypothetical protein
VRPKLPRVSEKVEQAHIVQLARTLGCTVMVLGTVRRGSTCPQCGAWVGGHRGTQQTPGIPDLEVWLPARAATNGHAQELVKWETKASDGAFSPEQLAYRALCAEGGVTWGCGTFANFEQFCAGRGLLSAKWIPHYRQLTAKVVQ